MFELSLKIAVLMMLTAAIPFGVRSRWICGLLCLAWLAVWGLVHLVNSHIRFVPAVGALYLLLIAAFAIARWRKLGWLGFPSLVLASAAAAYGIAMLDYIPAYREHQELLSRYPAVDLKPRLADEQPFLMEPGAASAKSDVAAEATAPPKYDGKSLYGQEEALRLYLDVGAHRIELRRRDRRLVFRALAQVHEEFVADFVAQPGVGRTRMPGMKLLRKESFYDEAEGVRLDVPPERMRQPDTLEPKTLSAGRSHFADEPPSAESRLRETMAGLTTSIPRRDELKSLHDHNIANFVPLYSLGGVDRDMQARGFEAHAFRLAPMEWEGESRLPGWRLSRLELVSLLKHRPPAVYVSDHLPAMEELRTAPTRPLMRFESDAIARLAKGDDLATHVTEEGELAMVGSIRAIEDCRECHRVPVGGLLGAFTYRLKPISPPPVEIRRGVPNASAHIRE